MSVNRWDPWRDLVSLREAMNGLLEESFVRPRTVAMSGGNGYVPLDLKETADSFILSLPLPGVDPEDVDISILGDRLHITGEFRQESEEAGQDHRWLIKERRSGRFERALSLPSAVVADRAEARFDKGVLTVTLPKADEARPKSILVRGESSGARQVSQPAGQPVEVEAKSESSQS